MTPKNLCQRLARRTVSLVLAAVLVIPAGLLQAEELAFELSAEEWARPRSGDRVTRLPAVRQVVEGWLATPDAQISIHYPGGESGTLWATELRDWLVALGVPSSAIRIASGSPSGDLLTLKLVTPKDS